MADQKTAGKAATTKTTTTKTSQPSAQPTTSTRVEPSTERKSTPDVVAAPGSPPIPNAEPTEKKIKYGKRLNVTLNVATVVNAFHNALASRSVRYVQYALHERGFDPGNDRGRVDFNTRKAYAEFQRSIDERPTGVPTDHSLNVLGFDVS